jgi:hypothetical protein
VIQDQSLSLLDQLNLKRNFKHAWLGMDELWEIGDLGFSLKMEFGHRCRKMKMS